MSMLLGLLTSNLHGSSRHAWLPIYQFYNSVKESTISPYPQQGDKHMTIILDGSSLTVEKLVAIARNNEKVELAPEALERIKICRVMLEDKLAKKEIMYGTNTGIGEFSEKILNDDQVKEFQKYLIYNHAAAAIPKHTPTTNSSNWKVLAR